MDGAIFPGPCEEDEVDTAGVTCTGATGGTWLPREEVEFTLDGWMPGTDVFDGKVGFEPDGCNGGMPGRADGMLKGLENGTLGCENGFATVALDWEDGWVVGTILGVVLGTLG